MSHHASVTVIVRAPLCRVSGSAAFHVSKTGQKTVTWRLRQTAAGWYFLLFKNDYYYSAPRCGLRVWVPFSRTFITVWKAKRLGGVNHDGYEQLCGLKDNQSLFKTAQRRFRGQRIGAVHPVVPRVGGGPPGGAGQQRDHGHWSSRSVTGPRLKKCMHVKCETFLPSLSS